MSGAQVLSGGRTNRVWRVGEAVVKLYLKRDEVSLFANDPSRERAALQALAGTGLAPRYLAHGCFCGQDWLIYRHVAGEIWQEGTGQVARLLARLHNHAPIAELPYGANGSDALRSQTVKLLKECDNPRDLHALCPGEEVPAATQLSLIHGDPVPGNVMAGQGELTLIDWQCPQIGDPAEDLAMFLSPAMQLIYRGRALTQAEEEQFCLSYSKPEIVARYYRLKPWFHWRMAAYCHLRGDMAARDLECAALQSNRPNSA